MYKLIRNFLFTLDPESIHDHALTLGNFFSDTVVADLAGSFFGFHDKRLHTNVSGIGFDNPVGLAAGFDKNGTAIDFLSSLGFGFIEIGSISAKPSSGNPGTRLFRLPEDNAIINRMGLNNNGADEIYERLNEKSFKTPLGVNIVKTNDKTLSGDKAIEDFLQSFKKLYNIGDYMAINISCPNTEEGRTFEEKQPLEELLSTLKEAEEEFLPVKPLFLKISSDISYKRLDDILDTADAKGIKGYIISNTSSSRKDLNTCTKKISEIGKGGLSGKPIRERSTDLIAYTHRQLNNSFIIGLGGIFSPEDAFEKIRKGASLVQIYTGLIYEGPGIVERINRGLIELLDRHGFSTIHEATGSGL